MSNKTYYTVTSVIFLVIGILHGVRVLMGWPAMVGDFDIPLWMSGVASAAALYLAFRGFGAINNKKRGR
jgi:hypothetical protein